MTTPALRSPADLRRLLEDISIPKRFDARIRLQLSAGEALVRRRVVAGSWPEAQGILERLPWEDQTPDGAELEAVEFELVTWETA